ncbi:MFS transporter [Tistrella bauzanensis]|uniref:MFS transporter n=1 Tax=Tistrella bauzanensis TaxID=657419 RepID=A0ABQ1I9M3_9PROT|nr:MFS transporter [Tistrella bauzanensis]GGB27597.1 MFS transporter [Tistrella bauzanensis]
MTEYRGHRPAQSKPRILAAVCLAALVLPLSFSAGAVSTPAIARALGGDPAALTWITNAFMLTFGGCMMAAGALADQFGRKRVFLWGLGVFAVTSAGLGLSPTVLVLDLLRAVQGLGAAAALAGGSAALAQEFSGPARTRAFSLLGTTFGVGLAFGPGLAGVLIDSIGWRAVFLPGAILAAIAMASAARHLRESCDPDAAGLDRAGTISFTAMLSLFTVAVIQGPAAGWASPLILALFAGTVLMLIVFIVVETRGRRPMLDLSLFRYPRFVGVQVLPVATCYCYVVLLVLLPLRFIGIDGLGETRAGLMMMALSAPMLVVPVGAAMLTRWFGAGTVCGAGLLMAAGGLVWLGRVAPGADAMAYAGPLLVIGIGSGLPWGLMDALSVSVVPTERAGMAIGIFSTTRVAGEGVALAIVSALFSGLLTARLAPLFPDATPQAQLAAARRLATGDPAPALAIAGPDGHDALITGYADAVTRLLDGLAIITVICAAIVFAVLREGRAPDRDDGAG